MYWKIQVEMLLGWGCDMQKVEHSWVAGNQGPVAFWKNSPRCSTNHVHDILMQEKKIIIRINSVTVIWSTCTANSFFSAVTYVFIWMFWMLDTHINIHTQKKKISNLRRGSFMLTAQMLSYVVSFSYFICRNIYRYLSVVDSVDVISQSCVVQECNVSLTREKKSECLSCDDLPGLVGWLRRLLRCRWVLLWKRRGSIAMRPHSPQRPRAAASINLFSISCTLHSTYRLCLWRLLPHHFSRLEQQLLHFHHIYFCISHFWSSNMSVELNLVTQ